MTKVSAWGQGGLFRGVSDAAMWGMCVGLGDLLRDPVAQHGLFYLATCGPEVSWRHGTL